MTTANYYKLGKKGNVVTIEILGGGQRIQIAEHPVAGKVEARAVAAQYGAQPWNF